MIEIEQNLLTLNQECHNLYYSIVDRYDYNNEGQSLVFLEWSFVNQAGFDQVQESFTCEFS